MDLDLQNYGDRCGGFALHLVIFSYVLGFYTSNAFISREKIGGEKPVFHLGLLKAWHCDSLRQNSPGPHSSEFQFRTSLNSFFSSL